MKKQAISHLYYRHTDAEHISIIYSRSSSPSSSFNLMPLGNAAFWELERRALETFNRKRREGRTRPVVKELFEEICAGDEEDDGQRLSCTAVNGRHRRSDFKGRRLEFS